MGPHPYFPAFLNLNGKLCIVVGGGEVAARKVEALLEAGAFVRVISPEVTPALVQLAASGRLEIWAETYRPGQLEGAFLVVAATDDEAVNRLVSQEAFTRSLLVNVVDVPELSNFIFPSVLRRGPLAVAVSTGGASPALAARLRRRLGDWLGPEYGLYLEILAQARRYLLNNWPKGDRRRNVLLALGQAELETLLQKGAVEEALLAIDEITGEPGFSQKAGLKELVQKYRGEQI